MPLILGTYIEPINSINGFFSSNLLKQIDTTHGINNLIMTFGESHTLVNYKLCKNMPDIGPLCNEIPDYITKLNEFASHFRTTVYIEGAFDLNDVKKIHTDLYKLKLKAIQTKAHDLHTMEQMPPRETYQYNINNKRGSVFIEYKSVMENMLSLYKSCIYRDTKETLCEYQNILWQYSDIRFDINDIVPSNFDSYPGFRYLMENYNDVDVEGMRDQFYENIKTGLEYFILMIDNFDEYIRQSLEVPRIKKQRDKLIPYYHTIFTDESFQQLFLLNRRRIISDDSLDELIPIKNKLMQYIQFIDNINDENLENLVTTDFSERQSFLLTQFATAVNTTIIDIYFILRLYKQSSSTNDNVFVNYFCGDNHLKNVKEYLVNIVNTHECIYEQNNGETNRYVTFEPDINIPILLQESEDNAYTPIPAAIDTELAGGRKNASRKRVSRKRVSRKRVSRKRRTKRRKYK